MRAVCFLLLIILISCKKEPTVPVDVIQPPEMAALLMDIYLLEAKVSNLSLVQDSASQVFRHFHAQILEKHGIDSIDFRKSMKFYNDEPSLYLKIHTVVVDSLSVREKTSEIN